MKLLLALAVIGLLSGTASADWDRNGWTKLGEQTVNGKVDRDTIRVGAREGSRTRVIDLPGDERMIQKIDVTYKNVRGGGNAVIEVWGFKTDDGKRGRR